MVDGQMDSWANGTYLPTYLSFYAAYKQYRPCGTAFASYTSLFPPSSSESCLGARQPVLQSGLVSFYREGPPYYVGLGVFQRRGMWMPSSR